MMMMVPSDARGFQQWQENGSSSITPRADVRIVTSGGRSIHAHANVLATASPVLESMLDRSWRYGESGRVIRILGVPCDAVFAFVRLLYCFRWTSTEADEEEMGRHGMHLLALAHKYRVGWLKRACEVGLCARLQAERAVDLLQLARLCDARKLYVRCMMMVSNDLSSLQSTEAWRFLQVHDPHLELEILQFIQEVDSRQKRRRRRKEEQKVYMQLNEAMECLQHICTEGCTSVGPLELPSKNRGPCARFTICEGLQQLIRHLAGCGKKLDPGKCLHCKRVWQLFRLHSSLCHLPEPCKVPLCKQFKLRVEMEGKGEDEMWGLLVKKVASARFAASLEKKHLASRSKTKPSNVTASQTK